MRTDQLSGRHQQFCVMSWYIISTNIFSYLREKKKEREREGKSERERARERERVRDILSTNIFSYLREKERVRERDKPNHTLLDTPSHESWVYV